MFNRPNASKRSLGSVLVAAGLVACSGSSGAGGSKTGGVIAAGGDFLSGGATAAGGMMSAGGTMRTGGAVTGGIVATGGTTSTGGSQASGGTPAAGGSATSGGARTTGGATNFGGATISGGAQTSGGTASSGGTTSSSGGSKSTGGATSLGGASAAGGAKDTGGTTGTGGTSTDRCDVGVYGATTPPQVLTLSGNLATHDPSAIESNGTYYEFQTGLGAKTSTNATTWNATNAPFATPAWMATAVPGVQGLWAPDISNFGGQYHLYYAGSYPFGANTSCIGHATRAALNTGSWTDQGSAIICSTSSNNWNAIDPNLVLDSAGTPWLVFGSWWSGIQIVQLNAQGTARANNTVTLIAGRGGKGIEGAFMVRRCGYYYLFTSWDACCQGFKSTYNIRVGRSTSINTGFVDKDGITLTAGGGTLVATGNGTTFNGPGGQSVMISGTKAYLVYHAYAPDSVAGGSATLRIADLVWDASGWPIPVGP
jgi:arabinan endo-1,5-alpha-L-arabinosidase